MIELNVLGKCGANTAKKNKKQPHKCCKGENINFQRTQRCDTVPGFKWSEYLLP